MLGLLPFVILCLAVATVIIALFALWHRRDIRRGEPWDADKAAKIYVGLIVGSLVAALGLASTPLVRLDVAVAVASQEPSETASVHESTVADEPSSSATAQLDGAEIVLTEGHGVDLDTADRVVLPIDGTPGLDVGLSGSYLHTPEGDVFERTPAEPDDATCRVSEANESYRDVAVDEWYCYTTSDGVAGWLRVMDVRETSRGTELTARIGLFGSPTPEVQDDRGEAAVAGDVTLTEDHGVDLDTADRVLLPTYGTPGLDVGLSGSYLSTPEGTSFVRATTRPTAQRCDAIADTNSYRDVGPDQWYCLTTSEGVVGYLQTTDVTDKASGTEVSVAYHVFGAPRLAQGQQDEVDPATAGEIVLTENQGVDLDTADRVLLPTSGTPGLDVGLSGSYLSTPEGTSFVRATTRPTAQRCDAIADTNSYRDVGPDQWYCFTTSEGTPGRLQVTDVTETTSTTEITIAYALFR